MKTYEVTYETKEGNVESQKVMAFDEDEVRSQFINVKRIIEIEVVK